MVFQLLFPFAFSGGVVIGDTGDPIDPEAVLGLLRPTSLIVYANVDVSSQLGVSDPMTVLAAVCDVLLSGTLALPEYRTGKVTSAGSSAI